MGRGVLADHDNQFSKKQSFNQGIKVKGGIQHIARSSVAKVAGEISVKEEVCFINSAEADVALTLPDGKEGQEILIICEAFVTSAVVTPDNFLGYTNITFDAVGDAATLRFIGGNWVIIANNNLALA